MTASYKLVPSGFFGLREMADRTNCTYRMLERWCTLGLIPASWATQVRGSGGVRLIEERFEPVIALLTKMQRVTGHGDGGGLPYHLLERIVADYHKGQLELEGFTITWDPE